MEICYPMAEKRITSAREFDRSTEIQTKAIPESPDE